MMWTSLYFSLFLTAGIVLVFFFLYRTQALGLPLSYHQIVAALLLVILCYELYREFTWVLFGNMPQSVSMQRTRVLRLEHTVLGIFFERFRAYVEKQFKTR